MTPQQWQETAYAQKIRGGDFDPADLPFLVPDPE